MPARTPSQIDASKNKASARLLLFLPKQQFDSVSPARASNAKGAQAVRAEKPRHQGLPFLPARALNILHGARYRAPQRFFSLLIRAKQRERGAAAANERRQNAG